MGLDKPFRFPTGVDASRAQAVRRLVTETPDLRVWEVMRSWVEEEGIVKVLQNIAAILEYNGMDAAVQAKALDLWSVHLILRPRPPCVTCKHWECMVIDKKGDPNSGYCWDGEFDCNAGPGCAKHEEKDDGEDDGTG